MHVFFNERKNVLVRKTSRRAHSHFLRSFLNFEFKILTVRDFSHAPISKMLTFPPNTHTFSWHNMNNFQINFKITSTLLRTLIFALVFLFGSKADTAQRRGGHSHPSSCFFTRDAVEEHNHRASCRRPNNYGTVWGQ